MPITLSIKNAPDEVVLRLKERAARHHRSLQGELMAIIEAAAREEEAGLLSPMQALERVRALGVRSSRPDSVRIVRTSRNSRGAARRR